MKWPDNDLRSAFVVGAKWETNNENNKNVELAAEEHYPNGKSLVSVANMVLKNNLVVGDRVTVDLYPYWESCMVIKPEFIVEHYTATRTLQEALASQYWAHFYIEPDGHILQRVPVNVWAPHAGISEWGGRYDLNKFSIGVEHVNYGRLSKTNCGWCRDSVCYPENEIVIAKHKLESGIYGWPKFTEAQLQSSRELNACLFSATHWIDIVGHEDICAKVDPGPAFPLVEMKELYFGLETESTFEVSRWWQGNDIGAGGVSLKWLPYSWSLSKIWCPVKTKVKKLEWDGRWVKVIREDGKDGWIEEKHLRRIL